MATEATSQLAISLRLAFPRSVQDEVVALLGRVTLGARHHSVRHIPFVVRGERMLVPSRIYCDRSALDDVQRSSRELLLLHCFFTRHHDGFVRERSLRNIIESTEPWVMPFVVQLAGEYVVEIIEVIDANRRHLSANEYRTFLRENPEFYARTRDRVVSYWDCYYRFRERKSYPGFVLRDFFDSLLAG